MDQYGNGCSGVAMALVSGLIIVGLVVLGVVWVGGQVGEAVQDARIALSAHQTERAQARADALQARADAERERTAQMEEKDLHREAMFYAWTVALAGFSSHNQGWLIAIAAVAAVIVGAVGIRWIDRRWAPVQPDQ